MGYKDSTFTNDYLQMVEEQDVEDMILKEILFL